MTAVLRRRVVSCGMVAWLGVGLIAGATGARLEPPPEESPAEGSAPAAPLLSGPAVPDRAVRTIVRHGMNGEFIRVEGRPEAAAAFALELDPEAADRVREIIEARSEAVKMLLIDHLDALAAASDAVAQGDRTRAEALQRDLWPKLDPSRSAFPLADPIAEALGPERASEFRRILDEYWSAWVDSALRRRGGPPGDEAVRRERVQRELSFRLFADEVRAAYDASLRHYRETLDGIFAAVDPSPEQREDIRGLMLEHLRATRLRATPAQRREVMRQIYLRLDEPQRERLFMQVVTRIVPDA